MKESNIKRIQGNLKYLWKKNKNKEPITNNLISKLENQLIEEYKNDL